MTLERTRQQRDPVGTNDIRRSGVLLCLAMFGVLVLSTVSGWQTVDQPLLAVASVVIATGAITLTLVWTSVAHAPFTRRRHLAVHALMLLAMALSVWSRQEGVYTHHDDPAPYVLAGLVVAMSSYRPAREIVVTGVASAVVAGLLIFVAVHEPATVLPPVVYTLSTVAVLIGISIGGAVFSEAIVSSIEDRRRQANARPITLADDDPRQHDRITVLSRDALPLMQRVLARGSVTSVDRAAAKDAARALRSILATEVDRTWLAASQEKGGGARFTIVDPDSLATGMESTRRTVLRAMLDAFANEPGFVGGAVTLHREGSRATLTIEAEFNAAEYMTPPGHPVVSAVLSIMGSVFTELKSSRGQARVLVKFGYEDGSVT